MKDRSEIEIRKELERERENLDSAEDSSAERNAEEAIERLEKELSAREDFAQPALDASPGDHSPVDRTMDPMDPAESGEPRAAGIDKMLEAIRGYRDQDHAGTAQPVGADADAAIAQGIRDGIAKDLRDLGKGGSISPETPDDMLGTQPGADSGKGGRIAQEAGKAKVKFDLSSAPPTGRAPISAEGTSRDIIDGALGIRGDSRTDRVGTQAGTAGGKGGRIAPETPDELIEREAQEAGKALVDRIRAALARWPTLARVAAAVGALGVIGLSVAAVVGVGGAPQAAPQPQAAPVAVTAAPSVLIDLQRGLVPTPRPSPTAAPIGATIAVRPVYTFLHTDRCAGVTGAQESFLPSPIPVPPGQTADPARTPGRGARVFVLSLEAKSVTNPAPGQTERYDWGFTTYRQRCNWSLSLEYEQIKDAGRGFLLFRTNTTYRFEQTVPTCQSNFCELATVLVVTNRSQ